MPERSGRIRWSQQSGKRLEVGSDRYEASKARIAALVDALEAPSPNTAYLVPGYWQVGEAFTDFAAKAKDAYRLAQAEPILSRTGDLQTLPEPSRGQSIPGKPERSAGNLKEGHQGRLAASLVDKRLKAYMKAVGGNPEEAVRLVIEAPLELARVRWIGLRKKRNRRASWRCSQACRS